MTLRANEQSFEIEIQTSIATKSKPEAEKIVMQQSDRSLKDALRKVGLPEGRFQLQPHLVMQASSPLWTPTIVALVCASTFSTTLYTHTHVRAQTYKHTHIYMFIHVYMRIHIRVYVSVCIFTPNVTRTTSSYIEYIYVHTCTHTPTYVDTIMPIN